MVRQGEHEPAARYRISGDSISTPAMGRLIARIVAAFTLDSNVGFLARSWDERNPVEAT